MSTALPITRSTRQVTLTASAAQTVFTFNAGPVWELADLVVQRRIAPAETFTTITTGFATALLSGGAAGATVTFAAPPRPTSGDPATDIRIKSSRLPERSTDVSRASRLHTPSLEREFDKIITTLQEQRRDIDQNLADLRSDIAGLVFGTVPDGIWGNEKLAAMPGLSVKANTIGSTAGPTDIAIADLFLLTPAKTRSLVVRGPGINDALWDNRIAEFEAGERGPLFVWADPDGSDLVAGFNSGLQVWVGDNPTPTPGATDTVGFTLAVLNGRNRTRLYGQNIVIGLSDIDAAHLDTVATGLEINMYSAFAATDLNPWSSGSGFRKNGLEIVGSGLAGPNSGLLTAAMMIWVNDDTGQTWWSEGIAMSRVKNVGLHFKKDPGVATDLIDPFQTAAIWDESNSSSVLRVGGSHDAILNLSGSTFTAAILMPNGEASTFGLKNDADHAIFLAVDPGTSSSQIASLVFKDRGTNKWQLRKQDNNEFAIYNDGLTANALFIDDETNIVSVSESFYIGPATNPLGLSRAVSLLAPNAGTAGFDFRVASASGFFGSTDGASYAQIMTAGAFDFIIGTDVNQHTRFRHGGGIAFPTFAGDPASPNNGDVWFNSSTGKLRVRAAGTNVDLH